jgi:ribosomal protein S7
MIKNKNKIINKILNHITKNGKKIKSEQILLKSIKELQKPFKKQIKKIIQLTLISSSPIFKVLITTFKKRKKKKDKISSTFILNQRTRISFAIKSIINETKKHSTQYFYKTLKKKIIEINQLEGPIISTKNETQKKVVINKHLFKYYK